MENTTKEIAPEEYARIFEQYVDICNQSIEKNKDKFPYMEMWKARWKNLTPNQILQCAIYDTRPKVIYKLQLTEDMKIKIISKTEVKTDDTWPFNYEYLKQVVDNPQKYIEKPAELDWGWMNDVFG
jgi:hypothetical protein